MEKVLNEKQQLLLNKLTMLWALEKIGIPLTEDSILDICSVKNDWIENYMDCKSLIHELTDSKLIYKLGAPEDGKELFAISYEGRECLESLYRYIPFSLRENISQYVQVNRLNVKSSQEYTATYSKNEDGSYNVILRIYEPLITVPMFELKIKAPSRQSANEAIHKWKTSAPTIYETIYEKLINTD